MSDCRNSKAGRRSAAPLLISIFWLVSTIGATLGAAYMASPEANVAASDSGAPTRNETRLANATDNPSTPVQRPMRVAALEALHLKIKSGLHSDAGSDDVLLPPETTLAIVSQKSTISVRDGSYFGLIHNSFFSARAPPSIMA